MKGLWKAVLIVLAVLVGLTVLGFAGNWFGEAVDVAQEEVGPRAINEKYEWFKRAASQIRANAENIEALEMRNEVWLESIGPRSEWHRTDRETWAQYSSELSGAVLMYNRLVGEYNAEMSLWHTRFTNFGEMPHGWEDITPDKFARYRSK